METKNTYKLKYKIASKVYDFMEGYTKIWPYTVLKVVGVTSIAVPAIKNELDISTLAIGGTIYAVGEYLKDKHQDRKNKKLISDLEEALNKTR